MMNQILELYARCGRSLINSGVKEAVLPISETENAINLFRDNKLIVLGGDLYKNTLENHFESIYADWFYNGNNIYDSADEAKQYLANFQNQDVFVSFILKG